METSSPEQQAARDPRSARRRLIRGTFAAPVALTLASGGVAAQSLTCVQKRVQGAPKLPGDLDTTQAWVRVPVWTLLPGGNNDDSIWISGADINALAKNPVTSFINSTQWLCLAAESAARMDSLAGADKVKLAAGMTYTPSPSPPRSTNGQGVTTVATASTTRLVAIRVNAAGDIIGVVGDGGSTGSAITDSCWSSFRRP